MNNTYVVSRHYVHGSFLFLSPSFNKPKLHTMYCQKLWGHVKYFWGRENSIIEKLSDRVCQNLVYLEYDENI